MRTSQPAGGDAESLLDGHETDERRGMIVYDPEIDERALCLSYEEAAKRLAESITSKPVDDLLVMPLLFLWRHAIELTIKATIRDLCRLRKRSGDRAPRLEPDKVDKRLKKHDLDVLMSELEDHLNELGGEPLPEIEVRRTVRLLSEMDKRGTAFRYMEERKGSPGPLDGRSLSATLAKTNLLLTVVIDALTNGEGV